MKQIKEYRFVPANHDLTGFGILIMILVSITGCHRDGEANRPEGKDSPFVKIESVTSKSMTRKIELTGTIEAARVARIASPAEGPVLHCTIREGDHVKQGQVILTLGRKRAAEELAAAARNELAREEEDLQKIEQFHYLTLELL